MVAAAARGELRAGAGRAEVKLPADVALAGYQLFGRSPRQPGTPVYARSLLVEVDGQRVALVLLEQMTVPPSLVQQVERQARAAGAACTMVAATHSHSGPGGYDRSLLPQLALGRFDEETEAAILDAVSASLAAARADLGPARLEVAEATVKGLNGNRDRKGAPVDKRLGRLRLLREGGTPVATLVRWAAHPTLTPRGIGPSGDWPGFAMSGLEEEGGVAFVLAGAVGDTNVPKRATPAKGAEKPVRYGETIADRAKGLVGSTIDGPIALSCATAEVTLPPADLAGMVPAPLGPLVSNVVSPAAPEAAQVLALRLGPELLVGIPAEPTTAVAAAIEASSPDVRVIGAAQGYVSYTPGEAEMDERVSSARYAWFGSALAGRLERGAAAAIRAAIEATPPEEQVASPEAP